MIAYVGGTAPEQVRTIAKSGWAGRGKYVVKTSYERLTHIVVKRVSGGAPNGIRTRDLRLERAVS